MDDDIRDPEAADLEGAIPGLPDEEDEEEEDEADLLGLDKDEDE
ncbi:MAG: hypothetical protein AAB421_02720 [Patescibacteria group bacterium]